MNNKTELEKVKAEIESKKEEKEKYEKQLSQLKNQDVYDFLSCPSPDLLIVQP